MQAELGEPQPGRHARELVDQEVERRPKPADMAHVEERVPAERPQWSAESSSETVRSTWLPGRRATSAMMGQ
jgi:hypothetical protein